MQIKKVKVTKDNKITMIYEQKSKYGVTYDEYSFTCSELARPEFYITLQCLAQDVIAMCELPESYLEKITVKGVSFSYAEGIMGAVLISSMTLDKSHQALNLNTPHKASEMYNPDTPDDPMQLLDDKCIERLDALLEESELYIKGDRAQGSLFTAEQMQDTTGEQPQVH